MTSGGPQRRGTQDVAHDLANTAMLLEGIAARLERSQHGDAPDLRAAVDRLYELTRELSEPGS